MYVNIATICVKYKGKGDGGYNGRQYSNVLKMLEPPLRPSKIKGILKDTLPSNLKNIFGTMRGVSKYRFRTRYVNLANRDFAKGNDKTGNIIAVVEIDRLSEKHWGKDLYNYNLDYIDASIICYTVIVILLYYAYDNDNNFSIYIKLNYNKNKTCKQINLKLRKVIKRVIN